MNITEKDLIEMDDYLSKRETLFDGAIEIKIPAAYQYLREDLLKKENSLGMCQDELNRAIEENKNLKEPMKPREPCFQCKALGKGWVPECEEVKS